MFEIRLINPTTKLPNVAAAYDCCL
ncbi:unnamed protein product [Cyprideis torosa]|uniref:Uncharacterized protein n=1 Tax=Cyprideis torosa TaxID=163714 RepID=A0A7R8WC61_9CRUS|nr:unnamed protein product [Cyprideis torosa]CAG0893061.1 unnamed protein product [Cyprideis torosa]